MADHHRSRRGFASLLGARRPPPQTRDDVPVTSVTDRREHRVADWRYAAAIDDGSGRCVAVCGRLVVLAALATPAGQRCLDCLTTDTTQAPRRDGEHLMSDAYPDVSEKPRYRRDAYDLGPFEYPPSEMRDRRYDEPTTPEWPTLSSRRQTAEYGRLWLLAALDEHDVAVHLYDCEAALVIAEAGISVAQAVAGWIARAAANRT